jgi:hypothetical protein
MPKKTNIPHINSKETPRQIIANDFKSVGELPIKGGWGYSRKDAVIIDKNDPIVSNILPFDGAGIEYIFVQKRIYEELIIFRPKDDRFSGIEWRLQKQILMPFNNMYYDVLTFNVTAFSDNDWEVLTRILDESNGNESLDFDKEREMRQIYYVSEYWFDISSFYSNSTVSSKLIKNEEINKYDLIQELFLTVEGAFKFYISLKEFVISNDEGTCIAVLKKETEDKWSYELQWKNGKYIGEFIKPFKPTAENIKKFNEGCKELAKLFEKYIDIGDEYFSSEKYRPFGDMTYEDSIAVQLAKILEL